MVSSYSGLVLDQGVEDDGDFVRGRGDCSSGTELGFHPAQVVAQGRRAMVEGRTCEAEQVASAVFHGADSPPKRLAAADIVIGTEIEPGSKVPCGGPFRHVSAYFAEQRQGVLF